MFAPDPPQASHVLRAVITLRSGRAIVWEPPAMQGLPAWRALRAFRYREYASTMLSEAAAPCRPALVEYLLRKYDFGDDPPRHAFLVCERAPAAGPRAGDRPAPAETLVVHGPAIGGGA